MIGIFGIRKKLKALGIIGINKRNCNFIAPNNHRSLYPLVDDKLRTKQLAIEHGIHVPELFATVETEHDIGAFVAGLDKSNDFVIKPVNGSGGKGIMVIVDRQNRHWIKASGDRVTEVDIKRHLSNILSGIYSLGGMPDQALVEYRVKSHSVFDKFSYKGVPDVRVILYKGVPVMAMLRLPTRASDGKANLHQGAVGVGIDLITGKAIGAVCTDQRITHHPDTDELLIGFQVPFWPELRALSTKCHDLVPLGYMGVDIVIDQAFGPLVLELNARPGLSIQICNGRGLDQPTSWIDNFLSQEGNSIPTTAEGRVALCQQLVSSYVVSS